MLLTKAEEGKTYIVKSVKGDSKVEKFLFSLGCFEGEEITLISRISDNFIINIKDSRYAIDEKMAQSIIIENEH